MIKRASLRHSSKKSSLVSLWWEGNGEKKEDGRKQPIPDWLGGLRWWGGTLTGLLCRALAVFLSYLAISPIYFFINGLLKISLLILVTYPVSQNIGDCECTQPGSSRGTTASHQLGFFWYFQRFIAEKYSEKILSCGGLSFITLAITQIKNGSGLWKKRNNWKIDSSLCFSKPPEQFTISGKTCNQALFPLMSECRIMLRWIFQRRHFYMCPVKWRT